MKTKRVVSEETRRKMSEKKKGMKRSPEAIEKSAAFHRGKKRSPEVKEKISKALRARGFTDKQREANSRPRSEETRQKLSKALKGRVFTPEWRENISKGQKNREPFSSETRRKISEANKGRKLSPEAIAKIVKANTGRKLTPEQRWYIPARSKKNSENIERNRKIAEEMQQRVQKPEWKEMMRESVYDKGEDHIGARWWHIKSPSGVTYRFKNVQEFVRNNPHLFTEEELAVRRGCNTIAGLGLSLISPRKKRPSLSWHGWTWVFSPEMEEHLYETNCKKKD